MAIPEEKDPASPMSPIAAGTAPPPRRELIGAVREIATFVILGEPILERATKPAEKKQAANIG